MSVTSGSSFVILNSTARGKGNGTASERPQDRKSSRCSPEASVAGTEQENTVAADTGTVTRSPWRPVSKGTYMTHHV